MSKQEASAFYNESIYTFGQLIFRLLRKVNYKIHRLGLKHVTNEKNVDFQKYL